MDTFRYEVRGMRYEGSGGQAWNELKEVGRLENWKIDVLELCEPLCLRAFVARIHVRHEGTRTLSFTKNTHST